MTKLKAIARQFCRFAWGGPDEQDWKVYVDDAQAVLKVMREPSEDMLIAGAEVLLHHQDGWSDRADTVRKIYQDMIDAILNEEDKGG